MVAYLAIRPSCLEAGGAGSTMAGFRANTPRHPLGRLYHPRRRLPPPAGVKDGILTAVGQPSLPFFPRYASGAYSWRKRGKS